MENTLLRARRKRTESDWLRRQGRRRDGGERV